MSDVIVVSGTTVSGLVIGGGTELEVMSVGVAIDISVRVGGTEIVLSGGTTTATVLAPGGFEVVSSGGSAIATSIDISGQFLISQGGTALSATVASGGTMLVSSGGAGIDTISSPGAFVEVTSVVGSGQIVSGAVVCSGNVLLVQDGGTAISMTVAAGGLIETMSSGSISGTVIEAGGSGLVSLNGSAADTLINSGGYFDVGLGGWATNTNADSGASAIVDLVVSDGQTRSGVVVNSFTQLLLDRGGTVDATLVTNGGKLFQYGGIQINTTVTLGGTDGISAGTSIDPIIEGAVQVTAGDFGDGTMVDATISGSGTEQVFLAFHDLGNPTTTDTTIAGSGTLDLSLGYLAKGSIYFRDNGTLILRDGETNATLSGFNSGNKIEFGDLSYSVAASVSYVDGELLVSAGGTTAVLDMAGNYEGATFEVTSAVQPGFTGKVVTVSNVPCFAAGTLIRTVQDDKPVEALRVGDELSSIDGTPLPIVWIGDRRVDCDRHPTPEAVWPVCIRAHAFGHGQPARDLWLSPDHAIYAKGVLVPVKHLINGSTIRQVPRATIHYFHIELPRHDVILAESLAVESYLDTGDRLSFANSGGAVMLHPAWGRERLDTILTMDALGFAPLRVAGSEVDAIRDRLAETASVEGRSVA